METTVVAAAGPEMIEVMINAVTAKKCKRSRRVVGYADFPEAQIGTHNC
jgi:hypothetical protein